MFEVAAFPGKRAWLLKAAVDIHGNEAIERGLRAMGLPLTSAFRASRLAIRFRVREGSALPAVQLDGEEFPASERAEIEVIPRGLRLVVPRAATSR
jgi:diacylglycerol kinase family enzyme